MSVQLYTQEQIVHHVENASPTKFMYSFGKAERFPKINRTGKSDTFYSLPSMRMSRTAGIGFGGKSDFTKNRNVKTEYVSIKRDFDKDNLRGFRYSFGLGRDSFTKAYCPGYKNFDKNIPGPGKYNVIRELGADAPKYTLHSICGNTGWTNKYMKNPAPGAYDAVVRINTEGRYPVSNISNIKVSNFGLSHTDRFKYYDNKTPAPNAYKCKDLTGLNFNSKYRSSKMISMSQRFPSHDSREKYPGPGSYLRFSEFGILVPKRKKEEKGSEEKKNEAENTKSEKNEDNKSNAQQETKEKEENAESVKKEETAN